MSEKPDYTADSYARFVRHNFRAVYQFCVENGTEPGRAQIAAQRLIFALYHLEDDTAEAA
jgi:hypothetical protein